MAKFNLISSIIYIIDLLYNDGYTSYYNIKNYRGNYINDITLINGFITNKIIAKATLLNLNAYDIGALFANGRDYRVIDLKSWYILVAIEPIADNRINLYITSNKKVYCTNMNKIHEEIKFKTGVNWQGKLKYETRG